MRAPQREPAGRQPRRPRPLLDVLLCVAGGHERDDRVVELGVLRRGRVDGRPLVPHAVAAPADVDRGERRGVDLPAVGDRADPAAGRRLAQERPERPRVRLVLCVDHRPKRRRARVVGGPRAPVLDVRQRPQPQRVGRPARHRPRAGDAQPRAGAGQRLVLIGERVADDLGQQAGPRHRRRAPVAAAGGGHDVAAAVGLAGGGVEDRGGPHRATRIWLPATSPHVACRFSLAGNLSPVLSSLDSCAESCDTASVNNTLARVAELVDALA